ncbi:MAG TPA: UDP-2,3-diacylglucosamine diphosphatase [Gammaproteobacteria bacterium]|nr:UDP-2,3-diacylglucosamine diphosphatase [Gammaproteobacteria bacterium]
MSTLFIADLHLSADTPLLVRFIDWLAHQAGEAEAIYILGDLFEAWIGDDDDAPPGAQVATALAACVDAGTPIRLMHGNRDFLIGERFLRQSRCEALPDPCVIELYGRRTLLMHGDLLCSDDQAYQRIRSQVREPAWQRRTLALPLEQRRALAVRARAASGQSMLGTSHDILDVNPDTVAASLDRHGVDLLIHGHTHRPGRHENAHPTRRCTRIVLGDWQTRPIVLRATPDGGLALEDAFPATGSDKQTVQ